MNNLLITVKKRFRFAQIFVSQKSLLCRNRYTEILKETHLHRYQKVSIPCQSIPCPDFERVGNKGKENLYLMKKNLVII